MLKPNFVVATATFLAISVIATPPAFARGGSGGMGHAAWQGSNPPGFSHGVKKGWNGASVPPGWSKGKKMGWNGRGVPPGLYGR